MVLKLFKCLLPKNLYLFSTPHPARYGMELTKLQIYEHVNEFMNIPEANLEPRQASKMEAFAEIVNG